MDKGRRTRILEEIPQIRQRVKQNKALATKHWREQYSLSLKQGITPLSETGTAETFTTDAGSALSPLRRGPARYADPIMQEREQQAQKVIVDRAKALKSLFVKPDLTYAASEADDLGDRSVDEF